MISSSLLLCVVGMLWCYCPSYRDGEIQGKGQGSWTRPQACCGRARSSSARPESQAAGKGHDKVHDSWPSCHVRSQSSGPGESHSFCVFLLSSFSLSLDKLSLHSFPFLAIPCVVAGEPVRYWVPFPVIFSVFLILWMVHCQRTRGTWPRWMDDVLGWREGGRDYTQARSLHKRLGELCAYDSFPERVLISHSCMGQLKTFFLILLNG